MFEYRVLTVRSEVGAGHGHSSRVWLRAPDGAQVVLPASVVLEMIDGGHSLVRSDSQEGLVNVGTVSCRTCGVPALDLEESDAGSSHHTFTRREREIFDLLCQGLTNRQISSRLWISVGTVKAHVGNVFRKLGVTNRTQAVVVGLSAATGAGDDRQDHVSALPEPGMAAGSVPSSPNVRRSDMHGNASHGHSDVPLESDASNRRSLLRIVR